MTAGADEALSSLENEFYMASPTHLPAQRANFEKFHPKATCQLLPLFKAHGAIVLTQIGLVATKHNTRPFYFS